MKTNCKNGISFVVSLITMFLILAASLSFFLNKVVFNENTYTNALEEEQIYEQVESYIDNNVSYLLTSVNIPENTLKGIISEKEIEGIFSNYIYNSLNLLKNADEELGALNTSIYEKRIDDKLTKYLKKNDNYYFGMEFNDNLEELKSSVLNVITSSLQVVNLDFLSSSKSAKLIAKVLGFASGIEVFSFLVLEILFFSACQPVIWRRGRRARRYAWIAYPFISSGLLVFLVGFSGYLSGFYENMPVGVLHLKNTISIVIQRYLLNFTYIGIALIGIGLLFMFIYWRHLFHAYNRKRNSGTKVMEEIEPV